MANPTIPPPNLEVAAMRHRRQADGHSGLVVEVRPDDGVRSFVINTAALLLVAIGAAAIAIAVHVSVTP